ncbi:hypothetical protein MMC06_002328 [Schaereria dolodes]|nr:hypothetical protein [Schaereria dolodes]
MITNQGGRVRPAQTWKLSGLFSLLLFSHCSTTNAQLSVDNGPAAAAAAAAAATSSTVPVPTGYGAPEPDQPQSGGIVKYYFLLLGLLIVLIVAVYWMLVRRRRRKIAQSRNGRHSALARDLEGWPGGRRWAQGRWRTAIGGEPRPEEGLNERGEAPPPYVPTEHESRSIGRTLMRDMDHSIPLQNLSIDEAKPPDYEHGTAPEDLDLTRPAPAFSHHGRQ